MSAVVRSRAPLRLGLAGGGSDVLPYSDTYGGRILNATIDKFAYAFVTGSASDVEFASSDRDMRGRAAFADLDTLRGDFLLHVGVLRHMCRVYNDNQPLAIRFVTQVDAPPGSGLGSSSTLVVAMVAAVAEYLGVTMGPYELARTAWQIEREELGLAGGWQDHYAAAFGGFNYMESRGEGKIIVNPLRVRRTVISEFEASLVLYFGGVSRESAEVIAEQQGHIESGNTRALEATHLIRAEAELMKDCLVTGDMAGLAASLRQGWAAKKELASRVSTQQIEEAYEVAERHGMIAAKVSGAGGGGFMMMLVDPERRAEVTTELVRQCGGIIEPCHFTSHGAETWRV